VIMVTWCLRLGSRAAVIGMASNHAIPDARAGCDRAQRDVLDMVDGYCLGGTYFRRPRVLVRAAMRLADTPSPARCASDATSLMFRLGTSDAGLNYARVQVTI